MKDFNELEVIVLCVNRHRTTGLKISRTQKGSRCTMAEEDKPDWESMFAAALIEIQYLSRCVRAWPSQPDESLVAAWSPLLIERLDRIEQVLDQCRERMEPPPPAPRPPDEIWPGMRMADVERIHILRTLEQVGGNREKAAHLLNIGARTLYRKLREYGVT
jgi:transcriptional regulator with GAF, ATPase, and Fis domain